jgi:hypothetical protein
LLLLLLRSCVCVCDDPPGGVIIVWQVLSSPDAAQRLAKVKGIGRIKAGQFKQDWDANTAIHESFTWLHSLGERCMKCATAGCLVPLG